MSKELKSLQDHNYEIYRRRTLRGKSKMNGIACPRCGEELMDTNTTILMSDPPKRDTNCSKCDYRGYRLI